MQKRKRTCDSWTRDAHIKRYGVYKELVDSTEPLVDFLSPTDPQIEGSSTSETNILFSTLINISLQEEIIFYIEAKILKHKGKAELEWFLQALRL